MLQPSSLQFLKGLSKNNNKPWFDAHRTAYETAKKDFENFIHSILQKHGTKDSSIASLDARKCMFRINRDVRFSKDKSPYKTNMGASMTAGGKKSPLAGYYFHMEPGKSFVGGGLYMPMPDQLAKVRQEIDYNLEEFKKIVGSKKFKDAFGGLDTSEGIQLSRVPKGYEADNPAAEFLRLKSFIAFTDITDSEITSKELSKKVLKAMETIQPLLTFLNRALGE